jgi:hypothetical protein
MRIRLNAKTGIGLLVLMLAACALAVFATPLRADDTDSDGLDCFAEVDGYCDSARGGLLSVDLKAFFPNVGGCVGSPSTPTDSVNQNEADLFVVLGKTPSPGVSLLPELPPGKTWLDYIKNVPSISNKLHVHQVARDPFVTGFTKNILVDASQKAVTIYEESTKTLSTGIVLGETPYQATPITAGNITVHTNRIEQTVKDRCASKSCVYKEPPNTNWITVSPGAPLTGIFNVYKKQVIAHEVGHTMSLTAKSNSKAGGFHYTTSATTQTIMDQSVYYTDKSGIVTWYFPNQYATADVPKLK